MYLKYAKQCCSTLKEGKKVIQTMSKALTRKWKGRRAIELRKGIMIRHDYPKEHWKVSICEFLYHIPFKYWTYSSLLRLPSSLLLPCTLNMQRLSHCFAAAPPLLSAHLTDQTCVSNGRHSITRSVAINIAIIIIIIINIGSGDQARPAVESSDEVDSHYHYGITALRHSGTLTFSHAHNANANA